MSAISTSEFYAKNHMEMRVDIWHTNMIMQSDGGTHARHNANTKRIPSFV